MPTLHYITYLFAYNIYDVYSWVNNTPILLYLFLIFNFNIGYAINCECQELGDILANDISTTNIVYLPQNGQEECDDEDFFVYGYVSGCIKKTLFSVDARHPTENCPSGAHYYKLNSAEFELPSGLQIVDVESPHSIDGNTINFSPNSHIGGHHAGTNAEGVYFYLEAESNVHGASHIPVTLNYTKFICNMWDAGYHEEEFQTQSTTLLGEVIFDDIPSGDKCDLVIDSVNNPIMKDKPIGEKNQWEVIVKNNGNGPCEPCKVSILKAESLTPWAEDLSSLVYEEVSKKDVPSLMPNEAYSIVFKETNREPTYWFNKYFVDSDYEVSEIDENNNVYIENDELFGFYEKKTLEHYGWPVVNHRNCISSVLNEPRKKDGIGRFHRGTDFIKKVSTSSEVLAVSSGKIEKVANDFIKTSDSLNNWYLKTDEFGYFHLGNYSYYNFRNILTPGRWLLKKGIQFFEMNSLNHVHLNDFSNRDEDDYDHYLNPFRTNGIYEKDHDSNTPIIDLNEVLFFINNDTIQLEQNNLFGDIEVILPVKDISSAGFRCGIYSYSLTLKKSSNNQQVYYSDWQEFGQEWMKSENYDGLYNDVYSTCSGMGVNCPGFTMILTNNYYKRRYGGAVEHYEYIMRDGFIPCDNIVSKYGAGEYELIIKIRDAHDRFYSHNYTESTITINLVENE